MRGKLLWIILAAFLTVAVTAGYFLVKMPTFYYKNKIYPVFPINSSGENLPEKLVVEPGVYKVNGKNYRLQKEGLYRFREGHNIKNRIVYKNDIWAILSGIAWLENHEGNNKNIKPSLVEQTAINGNVGLSCGNVSSFANIMLKEKGIDSRSVMGLNLQYDWKDKVDNGHTVLETKIGDQWVLTDLDNNVVFKDGDRFLNFWEVFQRIKENKRYTLVRIASDKTNKNKAELKSYYQKMFQVPFIFSGKYFMFTAEGEAKEKAQKYSRRYRFLERADWLECFYPGYGYR